MVGKGGEGCTLASMPACSAAPQHVAISMRRTGSSERVSTLRGAVTWAPSIVAEKLATAPYCIGLISGLHETIKPTTTGGARPFPLRYSVA